MMMSPYFLDSRLTVDIEVFSLAFHPHYILQEYILILISIVLFHSIVTRTRYRPAFSIVPQPVALAKVLH
jgi:hypothetical protein